MDVFRVSVRADREMRQYGGELFIGRRFCQSFQLDNDAVHDGCGTTQVRSIRCALIVRAHVGVYGQPDHLIGRYIVRSLVAVDEDRPGVLV